MIICPECGSRMVLRETNKFEYGDGSSRKFYGCVRYPQCKGAHGANPDGTPLGEPATAALKKLRIEAHKALDRFKLRYEREYGIRLYRGRLYEMLSERTGISPGKCHIGMFNEDQCKLVMEVMRDVREKEAEEEVAPENVDQGGVAVVESGCAQEVGRPL